MNRTRKIAAAAAGAAVILVVLAMVLLNPTLHTQTPVSTAPPTSGGTGNGGSGANGTSGASNGTSTSCTANAGNETGENGDHDGSAASTCGDPPVDHDAMGDKMSSEHRNIAADEHIHSGLEADAIALASLGRVWATAAAQTLGSLGASFAGLL